MALATKKLPPLPSQLDDNLDEIDLAGQIMKKPLAHQKRHHYPSSPLRHQIDNTYPPYTKSAVPSAYQPHLRPRSLRTPKQYRKDTYTHPDSNYFSDADFLDDDEIDELIPFFNVPLSQPLVSFENRDRFTFINQERKFSIATDSTRASSILSHESDDDDSFETDLMLNDHTHTVFSERNLSLLSLSSDALELTMEFNKNEMVQINEESRLKRQLLLAFKSLQAPPNIRTVKSADSLPMSTKKPYLKSTTSLPSLTPSQKYLTFTRPVSLPPKSSYDRLKHQKESEDMICHALEREKASQRAHMTTLLNIRKLRQNDLSKWENEILPNGSTVTDIDYSDAIQRAEVKEMYWRGLPKSIRSQVWWKQTPNTVRLSDTEIQTYFDKYSCLMDYVNEDDNRGKLLHTEVQTILNKINHDLINTFPDMNCFQGVSATRKLKRVVVSFMIFMSERLSQNDRQPINSVFFKSSCYFPALSHLASLFFYTHKSTFMTFTSLCNMFSQDKLLYVLISHRMEMEERRKEMFAKMLQESFIEKFDEEFKKKLNRLYIHFEIMKMNTMDYLPDLLIGLFSNLLNFDLSCHILDIWMFEKNDALLRISLGILKKISHKLYGSKDEILKILGDDRLNNNGYMDLNIYRYLNVGYSHEFIRSIQEI